VRGAQAGATHLHERVQGRDAHGACKRGAQSRKTSNDERRSRTLHVRANQQRAQAVQKGLVRVAQPGPPQQASATTRHRRVRLHSPGVQRCIFGGPSLRGSLQKRLPTQLAREKVCETQDGGSSLPLPQAAV
jgi:hypothetical protein